MQRQANPGRMLWHVITRNDNNYKWTDWLLNGQNDVSLIWVNGWPKVYFIEKELSPSLFYEISQELYNIRRLPHHSGKVRHLLQELQMIVHNDPGYAEAWYMIATCEMKLPVCNVDNFESAIHKVLEIDPRHLEALNDLGIFYSKRKNNEKAIDVFHQCLCLARMATVEKIS
jgi:tetratricopeptide (TPR) repeat protein